MKMRILALIFGLICLYTLPMNAQSGAIVSVTDSLKTAKSLAEDSNIHYNDSRVKDLILKSTKLEMSEGGSQGYRIQIYSMSGVGSSSAIKEKQADFISKFPNVPSYVDYQQPNYRLKVGDYRTKLDAVAELELIKATYPSAFIVSDKIKFPALAE